MLLDVDLQLAVVDLEAELAREQSLRDRIEHNIPLIHETLVEFMLNHTPKVRWTPRNIV